jgi:hypothetical protein
MAVTMTHPLDPKDMWKEAEALKAGEQEMLAKIGAAYLELEELTTRQQLLQKQIQDTKNALGVTQVSLKVAINALVKESGIENGDVTLDFQNRRIVPSNGQVSNSVNG